MTAVTGIAAATGGTVIRVPGAGFCRSPVPSARNHGFHGGHGVVLHPCNPWNPWFRDGGGTDGRGGVGVAGLHWQAREALHAAEAGGGRDDLDPAAEGDGALLAAEVEREHAAEAAAEQRLRGGVVGVRGRAGGRAAARSWLPRSSVSMPPRPPPSSAFAVAWSGCAGRPGWWTAATPFIWV